ncbi:MAG TPA: DUF1674 domain-containing protein [Steroidobacteraceae bacterium]|jgi:hypothetical protein|nr:DUF1674 domain-containing protein [Steroidobacteraceae bacterium]
MQLAVVDRQAVRGCLQQILADLPGMSMPAGKSPLPHASVPATHVFVTASAAAAPPAAAVAPPRARELGGRAGPEPTRFGDWEKNGRCIDF